MAQRLETQIGGGPPMFPTAMAAPSGPHSFPSYPGPPPPMQRYGPSPAPYSAPAGPAPHPPQQYGAPTPQPQQQPWSPHIPPPQQQQQQQWGPASPGGPGGWISPQPQQQRPTSAWGNIIPPPTLPPPGPASAPPPASPLQPPNYPNPNSFGSLTQSFADLSFSSPQPAGVPQQQPPQRRDPSPEKGPPSVVAPLPTIASLTSSASSIATSSDPASKIKWAKDVLGLVDRTLAGGSSKAKDETSGSKISDPDLVRLTDMAIQHIMNIAGNAVAGGTIPRFVAEALYLRAGLYATGSFPNYLQKDPRMAFKDYETAARAGYNAAWFKLGRDYESVGDLGKAKECFDLGVSLNETGCLYRLGMANLLGQLNIPKNPQLAIKLLRQAADQADLDTPQPAYVFGMMLLGQFDQVDIPIPLIMATLPPASQQNPDPRQSEAKRRIERAAYLAFAPAQYKLGWAYEYAQISCPFDPLLSVQYYSLASQQGETEADMALSKWFLCGSEGAFEKDEVLAVTFAEKAAKKGLPAAEFAMGYYCEVGIGGPKDLNAAKKWYQRAVAHKNPEAVGRLQALSQPAPEALSRAEHDRLTNDTLVRKRTSAKEYSVAHGMGNGERRGSGAEIKEAKRLADLAKQEETKMASDGLPMPMYPGSNNSSPIPSPQSAPRPLPTAPGSGSGPAANAARLDEKRRPQSPPREPSGRPLPPGQMPLPGGPGRFGGRREDSAPSGIGRGRPPNGLGDDRRRPSPSSRVDSGFDLPPAGGRRPAAGAEQGGRPPLGPERQSYSLSDGPSPSIPKPSPQQSPPPQEQPHQQRPGMIKKPAHEPAPAAPLAAAHGKAKPGNGPQTFAEMGFHSAPVQDKDCIIM
ncbi:hypothetical protein FS837_002165 [Tulasnella sp. UAMH 9824]|nr:hypothetical protein FS837_002165 [Tulasnella sp. UAMH 9824]